MKNRTFPTTVMQHMIYNIKYDKNNKLPQTVNKWKSVQKSCMKSGKFSLMPSEAQHTSPTPTIEATHQHYIDRGWMTLPAKRHKSLSTTKNKKGRSTTNFRGSAPRIAYERISTAAHTQSQNAVAMLQHCIAVLFLLTMRLSNLSIWN